MNGLEAGQKAVDLWGRYSTKNKASAYLYCQSFAGFYVPWAVTGKEPTVTYASARLAALASYIFTKDVNSADLLPGDHIFFVWGTDWHVVNVIGRDATGRTLVLDTSSSGDVVASLGRHVYVRHADTISLAVYGASRANGRGARVTFDAWNGSAAPSPTPAPTPAPAATGARIDLSSGWAWYASAADAERQVNPHGPKWTGEQLARGVYSVIQAPGAIQIRANDGSAIWVSPKARGLILGSVPAAPTPAPTPVPVQRAINFTGRAWYNSADEARAERNPHGPKWTRERFLVGTYPVTAIAGNGAVQVRANDGSQVWVSPRDLPPIRG